MAIHTKFLFHNSLFRKIAYRGSRSRADYILMVIEPYLKESDRILDIGAGSCAIAEVLRNKKFSVTPLDIENLSLVSDIKPLLYDGKVLPFQNNAFDVSLLISTLHHLPKPEEIVLEARRISRTIIIVEDIFDNRMEEYITYFFDSLLNQEFKGHPHSNKTDSGWRSLFKQLDLTLRDAQYKKWFFVMRHSFYYLEK
ncbi:MAG: methyltransferase domain-containing protein [Patescibacteria group bacterium]